jgi:opacity protein-like surface antigen
MKKELGLTLAAIVATLPLLTANSAQTIDFGSNLPTGTVADGYAGFDWHGAQNDVFADTTPSFFGSVFITEFSRTAPFDLNSMVVQELNSDAPSIGETSDNTTMIFGYLNGTRRHAQRNLCVWRRHSVDAQYGRCQRREV